MEIAFIVLLVIETLAIGILLFLLIRNNHSYKNIKDKAEMIVKGKLDVEDIRIDGAENNTAVLASAFNSIKSNLLTFVEATKDNVITLSDAIDVLSKSVEANQLGNEQIADSVSTVAIRTGEQLELVKKNLSVIESNNEQMQEIDKAMLSIKTMLDETVEISKRGITNLDDYSNDMSAITTELENSNKILTKFNDEIKRISEVGEFIIGISEQLKLLALNASIEAARAGQSGKGFAVVADEMNEMSEKTKEGMVTINEILGEVIQSSQQVNESIKNCEVTFNQSKQTFNDVNSSFQSINQQAFYIHDNMSGISNKFVTIAQNSEDTKSMASNIYEASQSISASTHEMAAATQETAAESAQIGENVESLRGMLTGIQNLLKQFNTAIVPVEKPHSKTIKIAFLSMLDNDFWFGVRRGVFYAQRELVDMNAVVEYSSFENSPREGEMNDYLKARVKQLMDEKFDVIILPGFMDGANQLLDQAISRGIKVVVFNCDCMPSLRKHACFSPNSVEAGVLAAKCMAKALNKKGNIITITGDLTINVNKGRTDGFNEELKSYKDMHLLDTCIVVDQPDAVYKKCVEILKTHHDLNAIFITTGMAVSAAKAIVDTGNTGKVILVGYDQNEEIYSYIKKGVIAATIGQDPFGQGHDPIIWMYNQLVTGEPLPNKYMSCRLSVVDKDNVNNLII